MVFPLDNEALLPEYILAGVRRDVLEGVAGAFLEFLEEVPRPIRRNLFEVVAVALPGARAIAVPPATKGGGFSGIGFSMALFYCSLIAFWSSLVKFVAS